MFEIEYKGGNSIVISTKNLKLISDPKLSLIGLSDVNTKDAVELATEERFLTGNSIARLVIEGPGEYEIDAFSIKGVPVIRYIDTEASGFASTAYRIVINDANIALLGNIAGNLSEDQLEAIGVVDILIIPVGGGGYTLDGVQAARLARQIDPKVVIPIHYADSGINYEVPQENIDSFIEEMGVPVENVDKYKVKSAAAFPQALTTVVVKRT